jgi:hypothetical protein
LRRIEAIMACREALDANAHPLLATEAMMLSIRSAGRSGGGRLASQGRAS